MTGYSKPRKTYTSINDARLAAKRNHSRKNAPNWIVSIGKDNKATIIGQVWYPHKVWVFEKYLSSNLQVLKSDGSLGPTIDWNILKENPKYYK